MSDIRDVMIIELNDLDADYLDRVMSEAELARQAADASVVTAMRRVAEAHDVALPEGDLRFRIDTRDRGRPRLIVDNEVPPPPYRRHPLS